MARAPSASRNQPRAKGISFNWKTRGSGTSRAPAVPAAERVPQAHAGDHQAPDPGSSPKRRALDEGDGATALEMEIS